MAHNFTQEGTYDESALLYGDWSEIYAEKSSVQYRIGNCPEGVLEVGREYIEHQDTSFPRTTDLVVPTRVWMKYTGKVEEINSQNTSWLMGQTLNVSGQNYLYVGDLQNPYYFSLYGKRTRVSDSVDIVFKMHKCLVRSVFSLGSGDEWAGSPLEIEALNDVDGDYGGSASDPLGWIWVPDQGS